MARRVWSRIGYRYRLRYRWGSRVVVGGEESCLGRSRTENLMKPDRPRKVQGFESWIYTGRRAEFHGRIARAELLENSYLIVMNLH